MSISYKQRWKEIGLHQIIFIDIETAAFQSEFDLLTPRMRDLWLDKANKINDRAASDLDDPSYYASKASLYAEFGRVVCVSAGCISKESPDQIHIKSYCGADERKILEEVAALLNKQTNARPYLCGHNIKEFDIPYLGRRMLSNGVSIPNQLDLSGLRPWDISHIDTMELWRFGDNKNYTKLDLILEVVGIDSPKNDMSGADVNPLFWSGELERIARYCEGDVVAVANLFRKLRGFEVISTENVKRKI